MAKQQPRTIAVQDAELIGGLDVSTVVVDGFEYDVMHEYHQSMIHYIRPRDCQTWLEMGAAAFSSEFERDVHSALEEVIQDDADNTFDEPDQDSQRRHY